MAGRASRAARALCAARLAPGEARTPHVVSAGWSARDWRRIRSRQAWTRAASRRRGRWRQVRCTEAARGGRPGSNLGRPWRISGDASVPRVVFVDPGPDLTQLVPSGLADGRRVVLVAEEEVEMVTAFWDNHGLQFRRGSTSGPFYPQALHTHSSEKLAAAAAAFTAAPEGRRQERQPNPKLMVMQTPPSTWRACQRRRRGRRALRSGTSRRCRNSGPLSHRDLPSRSAGAATRVPICTGTTHVPGRLKTHDWKRVAGLCA